MQKEAASPAVGGLKDGGEWMAGCATFAWLQDMAACKLSSVTGHGGLPDVCSKSQRQHDIGVV